MHLFDHMSVFMLVAALFVLVGCGMFISIVLGLLTGGPRARDRPGAPFLYDRLYYLLFLVVWIGWSSGFLAFLSEDSENIAASGFFLGWGVLAVGMSGLFLLRGDMMLKGAQYQAKHGFWLSRLYYGMQAAQIERQSAALRKFIAIVFGIAGVGAIVFSLPHLPAALQQVEAGGRLLIDSAKHF